jgi:protein required for attachment to host cells
MQLPNNLQHFPDTTLILIGNFGETTIYKTQEIIIDELRKIKSALPAHPDTDASKTVGKDRLTNTDSGIDEGEDRKQYTKQLAKEITDLVDDHDIKDIQLIMPSELLRRLEEELSKDITDLITRKLDKDLSKTNLVEALERLHEVTKPIKD